MNWHNVSKKEPCPICHKTDWCNLSNDGAVCICHRVESPRLAPSGSGWIHRLIDRPFTPCRPQSPYRPRPRGQALASSPSSVGRAVPSPPEQELNIHCSPSPSTFTYTLDFEKVHRSYDNDPILIEGLATTLGVDDLALKSLDVRFNRFDECWSFPMRDAEGRIVGLRYRELAGSKKWSARGSHDGLFYDPSTVPSPSSATGAAQPDGAGASRPSELVIVEGPSDTAAAMSLFAEDEPSAESSCGVSQGCNWAKRSCGVARADKTTIPNAGVVAAQVSPNSAYRAYPPADRPLREAKSLERCDLRSNPGYMIVGRSSCQTGSAHLSALIRRVRPTRITIVADNDAPGIKGAELLANQIKQSNNQNNRTMYPPVRILIVPAPYKDLRAWYLSNTLTQRLFTDLASAQRWR